MNFLAQLVSPVPLVFSSTCFFLFKLSSSFPSAPKQHNCSPRLTLMPRHPQRWRTSAALLSGCIAPILITLGEHTCENRCPPGLACCSSLGWSLCVCGCAPLFLFPPPLLLGVTKVPSRKTWARHPDRKSPRRHQTGDRKHQSPGFTPLPCIF